MSRTLVSYTRCPAVPTISALAHHLGLIEQEFGNEPDLAFEYKSVGFSPKIEYAHEERFWIRNAGHAPAIWKRSKGVDCKFISLSFLEGHYPVIALKNSGVENPAALKGKRLALFKRNSAFDLMVSQQLKIYQTTLATVGLTLDDVTLVEIEPRTDFKTVSPKELWRANFLELINVLADGKADAGTAVVPPDAGAVPDYNVLYDTRNHPDLLARVHPSVLRGVVVSGALLEERRDIVVRLLVRLLEAAQWALENPLGTLRALAADLKKDPEGLAASYENVAKGVQMSLSDEIVQSLSVQNDFLRKHGLIERDVALASLYDPTPLAEAQAIFAARK